MLYVIDHMTDHNRQTIDTTLFYGSESELNEFKKSVDVIEVKKSPEGDKAYRKRGLPLFQEVKGNHPYKILDPLKYR